MQHKTLEIASETTTDQGAFAAIAAAYTLDRQGDQIIEGAFTETITRWRESGKRLPVHVDHKGGADNVIGSINPATMGEIEGRGLFVEGELDIGQSDTAREAWRLMKAGVMSLSIGYMPTSEHIRPDGVRELRGIDLFEISLVPVPANGDTRILSMKSARPPIQIARFQC
jgi:Escherichia/Staphylococcus phage prohead protease